MIKQLEIDGVPTLIAPTVGPMQAGLAFRVGQADESLARNGITHLVEHLALHGFGLADHHYNGVTGMEFTFFHMQGSPEEVGGFITGVCAALRALPMHRLAAEKEILRTEASGRGTSVYDRLALWRFGARDYGLSAYPEWGLHALTPDDLQAWVAQFFNRDNAALWVAGDSIPAGLRLDLPPGRRMPPPVPSPALPVTPAWFAGGSGAVAWEAPVPRGKPSIILAEVLERRMFRALRQDTGLSYTVQAGYTARSGGRALITAAADALPEKQGAVLGGMVDVLAALRLGRITADEVASAQHRAIEELRAAEEHGSRLPGQVFNLLDGREVEDADEALAGLQAVTPEAVGAVASAAYASGLLMTPAESSAGWAGYEAAPNNSEVAVQGTRYQPRGTYRGHLIAGPSGVSAVEDDYLATVRYDALAVLLAWPDGGRRLIGQDGISVTVEPGLHHRAEEAVAAVDAAVPPHLRVDLPPRLPGDIPMARQLTWRLRWRRRTAWVHEARFQKARRVLQPLLIIGLCLIGMAGSIWYGLRSDHHISLVPLFVVCALTAGRMVHLLVVTLRR